MTIPSFVSRKILRKHSGSSEEADDFIAVERKLKISLNGKEVLSFYCTPFDEISIKYQEEDILVDIPAKGEIKTEGLTVTSGCAGGITFTRKRDFGKVIDSSFLEASAIQNSFREFQQRGELYRLTGCVHSAALSDGEKILVFAEDIGRHNAVDKVIGHSILEQISFAGKLMLVSGRLSSEIASKCSRWGIPIVASRTAPTDLAIRIAEASGVTLIGFVRGERMNIYTNAHRIIL
jgi:FdhD protein